MTARTQGVWKGAAIVSLFLLLFSGSVAAFDADQMQAEMDATFDDRFGSDFESQFRTFDDFDPVDNTDTTTTQRTTQFDSDWMNDVRTVDTDRQTTDRQSDDSDSRDTTDSWSDGTTHDTSDSTDSSDSTDGDSSTNWGDGSSDTSDDQSTGTQPSGNLESQAEQYLHQKLNQERRQRGLHPLDFDSNLQRTADAKSSDMASRDYFSHTSPSGDNFRDLYNQHGVNCRAGGENIARTWYDRSVRTDTGSTVHYDNAEKLADGLRRQWMTSSGHRDAILRERYNSHGIGIEITDSGRVYATEHFCT